MITDDNRWQSMEVNDSWWKLKNTKLLAINWSLISNINWLIVIYNHWLSSIVIDYRFHQFIGPGPQVRSIMINRNPIFVWFYDTKIWKMGSMQQPFNRTPWNISTNLPGSAVGYRTEKPNNFFSLRMVPTSTRLFKTKDAQFLLVFHLNKSSPIHAKTSLGFSGLELWCFTKLVKITSSKNVFVGVSSRTCQRK